MANWKTNQDLIQKLYIAFYGRPADPGGLRYWASQLPDNAAPNSAEVKELISRFINSEEAQSRGLSGRSLDAAIEGIYTWAFGRDATAADKASYQGKTVVDVLVSVISVSSGVDYAALNNKLQYANWFVDYLDPNGDGLPPYQATFVGNTDAEKIKSKLMFITASNPAIQQQVLNDIRAEIADPGDPILQPQPQTYTLTVNQDIITGTPGDDIFRAVAGAPVGAQEQTTLNSSDIIDGSGGNDTMVVLLSGDYGGGATIRNIENLQLGTNMPFPVTFDYNVNEGVYEITGVRTIIADQINQGETLRVVNVVRTVDGENRIFPTLRWANDSVNQEAGTVNLAYRAAEVTGTTDNQNVQLRHVANGQLNIGAGIETITLENIATSRATLQNSANIDTGIFNTPADIISAGSLTKVVLKGTGEIGFRGGIITDPATAAGNLGLVDRGYGANRGDIGIQGGTGATEANLLSVGARVLEVDASEAQAAVNVRFVPTTDGTPRHVTFKGGAGNDYVEFELGNVSATGGAGDDVFAFINGGFNETFTNADSIVGGAGVDTILFGLNGNGNINLNQTEFLNKTGIDVLDIRAANSTIVLPDSFVAAADSGFTVRTDRIVQTSADNPANPVGANFAEDNSVHAIDVRNINNRAITIRGGSGSDRIIANEAGFATGSDWDGGDNVGNNGAIAAAGDYDTITVIDNAVLSRGDLANIRGFEGIILTKSVQNVPRVFNIELTEAFLLNNTQATDDPINTTIDDRVFQIGTANVAGTFALQAGDTVNIDISDLLQANNKKNSILTRFIDVTALQNAGVTVNFINNGAPAAAALIAAVTLFDPSGNDVLQSAPLAQVNVGITYTSGIGPQNVLGTNFNDTFTLTQNDTVTGGNGNDTVTFNAGSNGARVTLGFAGAPNDLDVVNLNVPLTHGTGSLTLNDDAVINIGANLGAYSMNTNPGTYVFVGNVTINVDAPQTGLTIENGSNITTFANAGGTFTLGSDGQNFTGAGSANYNVSDNSLGGNDTVTFTGTGSAQYNKVTGGGIDTVTFANNGVSDVINFADGGGGSGVTAATDRVTVNGFNIAHDRIVLDADATSGTTGAGTQALVQVVNAPGAINWNTTANDVLELDFEVGGNNLVLENVTNGAALLTALGGNITVSAANDTGYVVAYDNGNAYLYYADANGGGANNQIDNAADLTLIAVFNNITVGTFNNTIFNFWLEA